MRMDKQSLYQWGFIFLLASCSFFLGVLWTKSAYLDKVLENEGASVKPTPNNVVAPSVDLYKVASDLGISKKDLDACLATTYPADQVKGDETTGKTAGVTGTPGAFLVDTQTGKVVKLGGAVPLETLKASMDSLLKGEGVSTVNISAVSPGDFVKGNKNARIALIDYSDFDCPFCKRFHATATQAVAESNGQLMWVYRHFPLDQLHPDARRKSLFSECIGKLKGETAFWSYADKMAE